MPVVTRSQSKMLNKLRETANSNVITRNQFNELKQLRQNINTPIHKKCARKTVCNPIIPEVKSNDQYTIKYFMGLIIKKINEAKSELEYSDKVRVVTEMYSIICDWFDNFICVDGVIRDECKKFIPTVYDKINEELVWLIQKDLSTYNDETRRCIKLLIHELYNTRNCIKPYIIREQF